MVLRGSVPSAGAPRCIAAASCEGSAEPRCTVLSWCEFASVVCLRRRLTGGKSGGALVRRMAAKVARSATQAEKSAGLTPKSKSMAKRNSSSRELSSAMGRPPICALRGGQWISAVSRKCTSLQFQGLYQNGLSTIELFFIAVMTATSRSRCIVLESKASAGFRFWARSKYNTATTKQL